MCLINNKTLDMKQEEQENQSDFEFERDRALAIKGDAEAQYSLGLHYLYGEDMSANYSEAEKWLRLAAAQGHYAAQYNLGCLYLFGKGVRIDYEAAICWLKKSVSCGNSTYQFRLGYAYYCIDDFCEAARWIRLSAEQGDPYAQVSLGSLYLDGTGVIKDEKEAMMWFRLSAEQGNPNAKLEIMKYNRRKAGLPDETDGCLNISPTLNNSDLEQMEGASGSFSSKVIELQKQFAEDGIPMRIDA